MSAERLDTSFKGACFKIYIPKIHHFVHTSFICEKNRVAFIPVYITFDCTSNLRPCRYLYHIFQKSKLIRPRQWASNSINIHLKPKAHSTRSSINIRTIVFLIIISLMHRQQIAAKKKEEKNLSVSEKKNSSTNPLMIKPAVHTAMLGLHPPAAQHHVLN